MRLTSNKYTNPHHQLTPKQWRRALLASIIATLVLALIPWTEFTSASAGITLAFIILTGTIIWLQWRMTKLQLTVTRLTHQVRRLSSQAQSSRPIHPQQVAHIDPKHFFNGNQTKH